MEKWLHNLLCVSWSNSPNHVPSVGRARADVYHEDCPKTLERRKRCEIILIRFRFTFREIRKSCCARLEDQLPLSLVQFSLSTAEVLTMIVLRRKLAQPVHSTAVALHCCFESVKRDADSLQVAFVVNPLKENTHRNNSSIPETAERSDFSFDIASARLVSPILEDCVTLSCSGITSLNL